MFAAFGSCRRVRKKVIAGEADTSLLPYAVALETSFVVFAVGGTFLNAQDSEMVWHFICLAFVLGSLGEDGTRRAGERGLVCRRERLASRLLWRFLVAQRPRSVPRGSAR